jgi:predicted transcriptional regulator
MKNEQQLPELPESMEQFSTITLEDENGFRLSFKERQVALVMLVRSETGMTVQQIADYFGVTRQQIYKIVRKPEVKRYQQHLNEQIFDDLFGDAVKTLKDILKGNVSPSLKLKAVDLVFKGKGLYKQEMTHKIEQSNQPKSLDDLEREVIDLEGELLGD